MRILAIRGENLASLRDPFELDFQTEPLASAGLYTITGRTGAGKSTILDAVCLALYNNTPRLAAGREAGNAILDASGDELGAGDPRQTLRRGAVNGWAEVDFVGIDGVAYRARWEVYRAHRRLTGRLQDVQQSLQRIDDGSLIAQGRRTECLEAIQARIGLSFEQFTRAVLLAQGEFAKFLKAKTAEKAELLERLTQSGHFSAISRTIYQRSKEAKQAYELLQAQLDTIELPDPEAIEKAQQRAAQAATRIEVLKAQVRESELRLQWLAQRRDLEAQFAKAHETAKECEQKLQSLEPLRHQLALWDAHLEIRETLLRAKQLQQENLQRNERVKELSTLVNATLESQQAAQKQLVAAEQDQRDFALQNERITQTLGEVAAMKASLKTLQHLATESENFLQKAQQEASTAHRAQKEWLEQTQALATAKVANQSATAKLEPLRDVLDSAGQTVALLRNFREQTVALRTSQAQAQKAQEKLSAIEEESVRIATQREQLARQVAAEVLQLRKELQEGAPCPVCGSMHHPLAGQLEAHTLEGEEIARQQAAIEASTARLALEKTAAQQQADALAKEVASSEAVLHMLELQLPEAFKQQFPAWREEVAPKEDAIARLEQQAAQWKTLAEDREKLDQQERNYLLQGDSIRENAQRAQSAVQDGEKSLKARQNDVEELQQSISAKLHGLSEEEIATRQQRKQQRLEQQHREALDRKRAHDDALLGYKNELQRLATEGDRAQQELASLQEQIGKWLAAHREFEGQEQLETLLSTSATEANARRAALQSAKEARDHAQTLANERKEQLDKHMQRPEQIAPDDEQSWCEKATNSTKLLQESEAEQMEATLFLKRAQELTIQHHKVAEQLEKSKTTWSQWDSLNDLFGSADGGRFRTLAQGYSLDLLLVYANAQLEQIMPRYRLERIGAQGSEARRSLALQIVDREMLDEVRPADTLSGGETFLVSLALSLGLSAISAYQCSIESLFIDEGFGSLDPESLGVVLDVLERLQLQGRKVALISHVQEMNERIAVKVEVLLGQGGASTVRVRT